MVNIFVSFYSKSFLPLVERILTLISLQPTVVKQTMMFITAIGWMEECLTSGDFGSPSTARPERILPGQWDMVAMNI